MGTPNYWINLFTGTTWQESLDAGGQVTGFRESRWKTVQRIKPGDYLLCYLTGVSRFIAVQEVVSEPFKDEAPIWKDAVFPCRLRVETIVRLTPETAVPVTQLKDQLTIFDPDKPFAWTGYVRGSPMKWKTSDGKAIVDALMEAKENPVVRPVDPAKLGRRPPALKTKKIGPVTVPESEGVETEVAESVKEPTPHEEVQWLLLKLGNDMGLDVWVARNDRGRVVRGRRFADLPGLKSELPLQFDEATNRTIELIDVLWLKGNAIAAAFEIETTTSIYSGLLRMSDLISMQPNLKIPLYLVAPDERRNKVFEEVNRPTFSRLSPPMNQVCKFIPTSALREHIPKIEPLIRYLNPDFLEELSEFCEVVEV